MTSADEDAFLGLLTTLYDVFERELKPGVVAMFWDALVEFPLATVEGAIRSSCRDALHFHKVPRPGDLRARCDGALTLDSLEAGVQRALAGGYFAPPTNTPALVRAVIKAAGGWRILNEATADMVRRRVREAAQHILASAPMTSERAAPSGGAPLGAVIEIVHRGIEQGGPR